MPSPSAAIIDVLSEESFAREHLPGAVNLCVYETAFLEKVRAAFPDRSRPLTICGLDDSTIEAATAVAKLQADGYHAAEVLAGGLAGWKAHGGEVERGGAVPSLPVSGRFRVDLAASFVHWMGRNLFNHHHGTLVVSDGEIVVQEGQLRRGRFVVDMNSLRCSDLTDSMLNAMLIAHLRSDDFFSVAAYPHAEFLVDTALPIPGATAGQPNFQFRGNLTVRGVTNSFEFPAVVARRPEGGFAAQALVDLDRTLWGSVYGSGKFFARLAGHVVNDLIHLHLKIVTHDVAEPVQG